MKKGFGCLGMFFIILLFGLSAVSCDKDTLTNTPKDALDGTSWTADFGGNEHTLTFKSPYVYRTRATDPSDNGTYTISGNSVTLTFPSQVTTGILEGNSLSFANDSGPIFTKN